MNFEKPKNYFFIKYFKNIELMLKHYQFKLHWIDTNKNYIIIKIN